jgi:pimeloyl-ACP methyl ester carboxylesterase
VIQLRGRRRPADAPAGPVRGRRRAGRWAWRFLLGLAVFVCLVTVASLLYNVATTPTASRPPGMRFVRAGNVLTRYREWGTTGSPVVLIPGAFETADTYAALGAQLGTTHRVYALDLTGTGYSQPKAPFTVGHFAAQLLGFINAMGLTGRNAPVVVGHSSGAAVAGLAALEGGRRIAGVMFLDGDALPFKGGKGFSKNLIIDPYRTSVFRLVLSSDWLIRSIYSSMCGPRCARLTDAGVEVWVRPFQQPGAEAALLGVFQSGIPSLTGSQLKALHAAPVAKSVVFGADDPQYSKSAPARVSATIGAPPPVIVPGRHLTMIASPRQVAAAIQALIARTR